ncbi:hypothetical protein [Candidatus Halobonum tyrrellensis]|uniref:Uncharacterized protein n=1 Tax=Candidatus Halobonum tyrrellensis G22 TaxID=1324957 RepID=V4GU19_9EURY|nr:hypothetical protein [Candidatus Halobonum tyrrellensis]ESP88626.1 hypothetical protein K933_07923 [Candidatus Halobonum tyrrellensis G22]
MPSEGNSPSAGWREVYDAMGTDPNATDGGGDRLRADGGREDHRETNGDGGRRAGRDPERCPDCKTRIGTGADDLCCEAHAERVRAARAAGDPGSRGSRAD